MSPAAPRPEFESEVRRAVDPDGAGTVGSVDDGPDGDGEPRHQGDGNQRLRAIILTVVSVLLLGALPAFFNLRAESRDPVFASLNELDVPTWAAVDPTDAVSGSRWCFLDCRLRERTVHSEREPEETAQVYESALSQDGWQPWKPAYCPEQEEKGRYTCWRRDELTLDLWVRPPTCVPPPVDGEPAVVPLDPEVADEECAGSLVTVKVRNAIDDDRTRPQPSTDPSLTGVDPFPTLDEDLLDDLPSSPPS